MQNAEKIAVFFWASDAETPDIIRKYRNYLAREGYTKFFEFKDSTNVKAHCQQVDAYERVYDTIFVYIIGHGENNGKHSNTAFRPLGSITWSHVFRSYMDAWESPRKCILVESCYSGDWADDFRGASYLAMSTADEAHSAAPYNIIPGEGRFSHYFFQHVFNGYSAAASFYYAKSYCTYQKPKMVDQSSYQWLV